MLLASFSAGLSGEIGKHVRIMNPQTLDQALKIVLSIQETERQEKFSQSFYANFDDSSRLRSLSPTRSVSDKPRCSADVKRVVDHTQTQRHRTAGNDRESKSFGSRNAQTKASLTCFECGGVSHYARECATRLRKEANSANSPGRWNPTERRRRSRYPSNKPPPRTEKGANKQATNQGNGN